MSYEIGSKHFDGKGMRWSIIAALSDYTGKGTRRLVLAKNNSDKYAVFQDTDDGSTHGTNLTYSGMWNLVVKPVKTRSAISTIWKTVDYDLRYTILTAYKLAPATTLSAIVNLTGLSEEEALIVIDIGMNA